MTRAAVVGVGAMGHNHARVYQEMPDVELAAVADLVPALAQETARLRGALPIWTTRRCWRKFN